MIEYKKVNFLLRVIKVQEEVFSLGQVHVEEQSLVCSCSNVSTRIQQVQYKHMWRNVVYRQYCSTIVSSTHVALTTQGISYTCVRLEPLVVSK